MEAALYRPQTGYYADLIEEAAALWESLSQNHPFIDGNKRTAFAATYTFLAINGARLTADAEEIYVFLAALYEANQLQLRQACALAAQTMDRQIPTRPRRDEKSRLEPTCESPNIYSCSVIHIVELRGRATAFET